MVRLATLNDAEQLNRLNDEFNGKGETSLEHIKDSLINNHQEIIVVDDENGTLAGFVCVQLKKSFCYDEYMPEITEVYVNQKYRRKGIAKGMISFAESHCRKNYALHKFELLTGTENFTAQAVYAQLGYVNDGEIHLSKRVSRMKTDDLNDTLS